MSRHLMSNISSESEKSSSMSFLDEIAGIKDEFTKFRDSIQDLSLLHNTSLNSFSRDKVEENNDRIEKCNVFIKAHINIIKQKLDDLRGLPQEGISPEIRKKQYQIVREDFMKCIEEYQKIQKDQRHKTQGIIVSKYKIINPDATEDEIEKAVENGNVDDLFSQNMLMSQRAESGTKVLKEVEQRQVQIRDLLKSIEELSDLYMELQYKVEEQDAIFDHVMVDIEETNTNLKESNKQLNSAIKYALSARGKKVILAILVIVILAILALVLILNLT